MWPRAGKGSFQLSEPCWTCVGSDYPGCFYSGTAYLFTRWSGGISNLTARVRVPGGGPYRLSYALANRGDKLNSWQTIIGSINGSFAPMVLESRSDLRPFLRAVRELFFTVPSGTKVITVTFLAAVSILIPSVFTHSRSVLTLG